MSTDKDVNLLSFLLEIDVEQLSLFICAAKKSNLCLLDWIKIELSQSANKQLDLNKAPPIYPENFKLAEFNQVLDGVVYDSFIDDCNREIVLWHDDPHWSVEMDGLCYFGDSEHVREQQFISDLYRLNGLSKSGVSVK